MIRKKKSQNSREEEGRKGRFLFSRDKKKEYNLYEDEIEYITEDEEKEDSSELQPLEEDMEDISITQPPSEEISSEEDIPEKEAFADSLLEESQSFPEEADFVEEDIPGEVDLAEADILEETDLAEEDIPEEADLAEANIPEEETQEVISEDTHTETVILDENIADSSEKSKKKKKKKEKKEKKSLFHKKKKEKEAEEIQLNEFGEVKKRKMSRKKIAGIVVICIIAVVVVIAFIRNNMSGGDEGKAYVESVSVLAGLGSANGMNNRYTGEVEAQDSWKISLQTDMSVKKCYVSVGDQVKKGDKLFLYNTEELTLSKERKELEVETLTNEINQLNKDIKTYEADLKNASTTEKISLQTEILTAQTTIKKNEYTIKSDKAEIKQIEKNIKNATVKSKMDGLVKSINASLGQGSASDDSDASEDTGDGTTYMTILAVGDYRVKGTISETNVWSISEGDPVIIRSRVNDETWSGSIKEVKTDTTDSGDSSDSSTMDDYMDMDEGSSGESATSYNFYVELDDDEGLMMGQHVFIEPDNGQDEKKEGIWIPSAYIRVDGEDYYVWAMNGRERLELKKIEVGEYNEELDEYQILSGLTEKDYIACDSESLKVNMKTTKVLSEEESTDDYLDEEPSDDEIYEDSGEDMGEDSNMIEDFEEEDFSDPSEDMVDGSMGDGEVMDLSGE